MITESQEIRRSERILGSPGIVGKNICVVTWCPCSIAVSIDRTGMFAFFDKNDRWNQNVRIRSRSAWPQIQFIGVPSDTVSATASLHTLYMYVIVPRSLANTDLDNRRFKVMVVAAKSDVLWIIKVIHQVDAFENLR